MDISREENYLWNTTSVWMSLKEISIYVVDWDGATVARRMRWGDEQAPISNRHLGLTKEA